jgi:hypothetical protein
MTNSVYTVTDASIARGDLETRSQDLERLLGRPATSLADVIGEATITSHQQEETSWRRWLTLPPGPHTCSRS